MANLLFTVHFERALDLFTQAEKWMRNGNFILSLDQVLLQNTMKEGFLSLLSPTVWPEDSTAVLQAI
uniref:Uncharacterized protein n=1 Tax=Anguilla anguilla TaxID=7936 RepID=A0A0E9W9R1_ANGAN